MRNKAVNSLLQQNESGKKSTVMAPLAVLIALCVSILTSSFVFKAEDIIKYTLLGILCLTVIVYIVMYIIFAFKNSDSLRSEHYNIKKMVIEKGLLGDNETPLILEVSNEDDEIVDEISEGIERKEINEK